LNLVADLFGKAGSVPRGDAYAAARCNELLGWFASSVHIAFAGIWRASRFTSDETAHPALQQGGRDAVERYFAEIEQMCGQDWLVGSAFSAADTYVLTFFRWGRRIGLDLVSYPRMAALCGRILQRPAVQRVLAREGLGADEFSGDRAPA
jgi:glutathione S-transferase